MKDDHDFIIKDDYELIIEGVDGITDDHKALIEGGGEG